MYKNFLILIIVLLTLVSTTGCQFLHQEGLSPEADQEEIVEEQDTRDHEDAMEEEKELSEIIKGYLEDMTLEEKVGQVFIEALRFNEHNKPMTYLTQQGKEIIEDYHLGGVILFSENISTVESTIALIQDMQSASTIPLFIAIDEEGGRVSRLNSSPKMPSTKLPGNEILGRTKDYDLAYQVGKLLGRELSVLGINMNLAPVADVNTNPKNPVIGDRSFGYDAHRAGKMVAAITRGMQDQNISAVLKHFPGHGDTSLDTHNEAVVIHHDMNRLKGVELIPFQKGIDVDADGIMLAHIQTPNITGNNLPATFSKEIVEDLLRNQLNYNSLIITDALEMAAIAKYWSPQEAAVLAFKAGADILLMPESIDEAYEGLLQAVLTGEITEERLNQSIERILTIKYNRGILKGNISTLDPYEVLGSEEHQEIVKKIMEYMLH